MTVLELNSGNENQQKGQDDLMSLVIKTIEFARVAYKNLKEKYWSATNHDKS